MTKTAYEATNSDVKKLIKYARINAECGEHASPEEILKLVSALENERKQKNEWKNLAKKSTSERIVDIETLLSARQRLAELEALCVKSNDAMREAEALCVKLPDSSSKAFWSGTGKTEQFHPETYKRWVKEAIERAGDIAGIQVEVK